MALAPGLLRGHVSRRPGKSRTSTEVFFLERQSKIRDKWFAARVQEDVPWLDVAMHQPLPVGIVKGLSDRGYQLGCLGDGKRSFLGLAGKRAPFDELRDDKARVLLGAANIKDGNDVGMVELSDIP